MKIKFCRSCKSKKIKEIFDFGRLAHAGVFPIEKNKNIKKEYLKVLYCKKCSLVQLDRNYSLNYMFGKNYGYKSGTNEIMKNHLKNLVRKIQIDFNLVKNDKVLDIASNDGTLINYYDKKYIRCANDPLINKFHQNYKHIKYKFSNFFSAKKISKKINNFKVITALAVAYDLQKPNIFFKGIKKLLAKDGILIVEVADLYLTQKNNVFDTFCHEHLEYYSFKSINRIIKKNGLKIFKHEFFDINGGTSRYFVCHQDNPKSIDKSVNKLMYLESRNKVNSINSMKVFFRKAKILKKKTNNLLKTIKAKSKTIHGYGASTKGNVLLQYFNINESIIDFIAERNEEKFNKYTPVSNIKIISEKQSRKLKPHYYFVLPWHFKKGILKREKKLLKKNIKFIFPLPTLHVCSK